MDESQQPGSEPEPTTQPQPETPQPDATAPEQPQPETPRRTRPAWLVPVACGLAAGLLVGAGAVGLAWALSGSGGEGETFTFKGTLTLTDSQVGLDDGTCGGYEGYDDIVPGAKVTIFDADGKVVGADSLGKGKSVDAGCEFPLSVTGVPKGSTFYQVEISHRGKLSVDSKEAENGEFAASLG